MTVVATPEPDGPPSRNDDSTTVRPALFGLPPIDGEREVDEELAGAGLRQERAVDREQDDERRRHVDRDAEDALERDVQVPDEPGDIVAAMRPGRRQIRPDHRVKR